MTGRTGLLLLTMSALHLGAPALASDDPPQALDIDRLFASPDLSGPQPRGLKISPDSTRVTFLRGKEDDRLQMDLWEYHLEDNTIRPLVDSTALASGPEELSEEERARRERLRIVDRRGIVSYHFSPDGGSLLFPLTGDLYLYTLATGNVRQLTDTDDAEIDPRFSPAGGYVSFVREQDLFVIDLATGKERRLTSDGGGLIKNGMAEFIAQEEMDRYTGYWWSPDESAVAFLQVDEAPVQVVQRFEVYAEDFKVYDQRYPEAGTPNVNVRLGVIALDESTVRWLDTGDDPDVYLPRVGWFPDSRHLAVQRQSRDQQTLELLRIDTQTGDSTLLLTERSDTWIDLHRELVFLEESPRFIWASSRSGYKHLYLYENDGTLVRALSEGPWEVVHGGRGQSAVLHVDEEAGTVYVTGTYDSPLERHVYALSLLEVTATPTRLSETPGWHRATFADSGEFYVDSFHNVSTPPQVSVHGNDGSRLAFIEENALDASHPYYPYLASRPETRFGTLKAADGQTLHYRLRTPAGFDPTSRHPVVVVVYGGPGGQIVRNGWSAGFAEVLTANGYIVFSLDNRGTGDRGVAFDAPIYRRLGHIEVADQVVGVEHLRSLDFVDPERIGVFGWSYGGYMVLMTMLQVPDAFAAGVSGAPVTDWTLYDTHYTERYMGTPQDNAEGYEAASVFPYVEQLGRPLLVMHGMADDNVLFTNSTKLFKALQEQTKDFDVMAYPGSKHALLRVPNSGRHGYAKILRFFDTHLK